MAAWTLSAMVSRAYLTLAVNRVLKSQASLRLSTAPNGFNTAQHFQETLAVAVAVAAGAACRKTTRLWPKQKSLRHMGLTRALSFQASVRIEPICVTTESSNS